MSALPPAELTQLFALFNARRHAEMERHAAALLVSYPASGPLWKALSIALQLQNKDALTAWQRAMELLPNDAEVPGNLGALLSDRGQFDAALDCYRRALALKPDFAEAHSNLALVLLRLGRFEEAAASARAALLRKPSFAEAHNNLGIALNALGQPDAAAASFQQALALRPDFAEAHAGLGTALAALDQTAAAIDSFRHAARLRPGHAESHYRLGSLLIEAGRFDAAAASLGRAIALRPADARALSNLGVACFGLGRFDEAADCQRRALRIDASLAPAHSNLGNALKELGRLDEAVASYRRALDLDPAYAVGHCNLGAALREQGLFNEAAASYRRALEIDEFDFEARSNLLFLYSYQAEASVDDSLAEARRFGELAAQRARPFTRWAGSPGGRLRVGFVSGDLRTHPVGFFAQSVLAALAQELDVLVYANQAEDASDPVSAGIKASAARWRNVLGVDDERLATAIHADAIDLLVDLSGHTAGNRLPMFAWRPAPVQLSWLGYCATTGLAAIDGFIADPWVAPPAVQAQFSETIVRLPSTFLCFTPPAADLPVAPLPALATGPLTFGCFNKLGKINEAVITLWSRVLQAVPGSRLLLKAHGLAGDSARQTLFARFAERGIAADRLLLEGPSPRLDYLRAYDRVDIALDPFPYPGGTTSVEGLWMGVPVLSLRGQRALSRQGESILQNLGLPDWIASDTEDYLARAVRHAADLPALATLRAGLRPRLLNSPLCDAPAFAAAFAATLRQLHGAQADRPEVKPA